MIKKLLLYRFNGPATFLLVLLATNAVIAFIYVGFFLALIQVAFSFGITFLGNKAEIWTIKNESDLNEH
jgi:hypothetical protein